MASNDLGPPQSSVGATVGNGTASLGFACRPAASQRFPRILMEFLEIGSAESAKMAKTPFHRDGRHGLQAVGGFEEVVSGIL